MNIPLNGSAKLAVWIVGVAVLAAAGTGVKAVTNTADITRRLASLEKLSERDSLDTGLLQVDLAYLKAGVAQIQTDLGRQRDALDRLEEKVRAVEQKIDRALSREAAGT